MRKLIHDEEQFKIDAKNYSLKEMAIKYGVKESTVSKWKKKLDVLTVPKNISLPKKDVFSKEVLSNTNVELAKIYGVSLKTISKWRVKLGCSNVWRKQTLFVNDSFRNDLKNLMRSEVEKKYNISSSTAALWKKELGYTKYQDGKKIERTVEYVELKNGCWLCTSHGLDDKGYPRCKPENLVAKRVWIKINGDWPKGKYCLHSCDNPACINPDHVSPGTQKENQRQMAERDRSPWGMRSGVRKLTSDEAKEIYLLKGTDSQRNIGEQFGVSGGTVWHIWNDATWWRDVQGVDNFPEFLTKGGKVE